MKLISIIFCLFASPAFADSAGLMKSMVDLRAELETLSREMESTQKERQAELDLWVQKRLELESGLQRETLRQMQLSEKTTRLAQRVKKENKTNPEAKRELLKWIASTREWINASLPFRRESRLQAVREIQDRVEKGLESLESLSAELWMFYECELKMAADNEFRLLDIESTPGAPQKVEAVRLGLLTMYTRQAGGELQQTVLSEGKWIARPVASDQQSDVVRLFENLKAKKDSGLYNLALDAKEVL